MQKHLLIDQSSTNDPPPPPPSSSASLSDRSKGLKKLGVSEDDVQLAEKLLEQIPACPSVPKKTEWLLGYASSRLAREKALRLMGTSEEEVELENEKNLGSLGIAGRRRSFSVISSANSRIDMVVFTKGIPRSRAGSIIAKMGRKNVLRRRHTFALSPGKENAFLREKRDTELRILRNQAKNSAREIDALRARIDELEKKLDHSGASIKSSEIAMLNKT